MFYVSRVSCWFFICSSWRPTEISVVFWPFFSHKFVTRIRQQQWHPTRENRHLILTYFVLHDLFAWNFTILLKHFVLLFFIALVRADAVSRTLFSSFGPVFHTRNIPGHSHAWYSSFFSFCRGSFIYDQTVHIFFFCCCSLSSSVSSYSSPIVLNI